MKNQSIANFFASVWSIVKKIWKWLTIKNIWMVLTLSVNIIGIVFLLWIIASGIYVFINLLGAFFSTTSFSTDNSWAHISKSFFNLSKMEVLTVIALAISGVNSIIKYIKIDNLEVENSELDAKNFDLKVSLAEKQLEIDALKEEIEFRDNKEIDRKIDAMAVTK